MITIRRMLEQDIALIDGWWRHYWGFGLDLGVMPLASSFIAEAYDVPVLAVGLLLTNGAVAWVEGFVGAPDANVGIRRMATRELLSHVEAFAKRAGYKRLFCMAPNEGLARYYTRLGFKKTSQDITTFTKGV